MNSSLSYSSILVAACLAFFVPTGSAETMPANIRIEVQIVSLPETAARPLVPELMDEGRIESAYSKIQELLEKGEARLIGWPILTAQTGHRATIEAIREIRYATEYDTLSPEAATDSRESSKGFPTAFETRNTGVTVEVEPTLSEDRQVIKLNIVPQHVVLKEFRPVTVKKGAATLQVEQPQFDVMKVTTSLMLRSGQRVLMGVFRSPDAPEHLEFFILKAETFPAQ